MTEDQKRHLSEINTGSVRSLEVRQRMSEVRKGIPHSPEHRKRISEAHKGKVYSLEQRARYVQAHNPLITRQSILEIRAITGKSINSISKRFGISHPTVSKILKGDPVYDYIVDSN